MKSTRTSPAGPAILARWNRRTSPAASDTTRRPLCTRSVRPVDGARGVLPEPVGGGAHRNPGHAGDRCVDEGSNAARSRNPSEEDHSGRLAQAERRHCAPCRQMTHHGRRRIACGVTDAALRASAANDQRDGPCASAVADTPTANAWHDVAVARRAWLITPALTRTRPTSHPTHATMTLLLRLSVIQHVNCRARECRIARKPALHSPSPARGRWFETSAVSGRWRRVLRPAPRVVLRVIRRCGGEGRFRLGGRRPFPRQHRLRRAGGGSAAPQARRRRRCAVPRGPT